MKENGENKWLKNLPSHTPPGDMWEQIASRMDNNVLNHEQLAGLPEHEPPIVLWKRIEHALIYRRNLRIGYITAGIAASLLIAFGLKGLLLPEKRPVTTVTFQQHAKISPENSVAKGTETVLQKGGQKIKPIQGKINTGTRIESAVAENFHGDTRGTNISTGEGKSQQAKSVIAALKMKPAVLSSDARSSLSGIILTSFSSSFSQRIEPGKLMVKKDTLSDWLMERFLKNNLPPPHLTDATPSKSFSVGLAYLPEPSARSGDRITSFKTIAMMAKYQLASIDIQTGLGISNQSAPVEYRTQYASFNSAYGNGSGAFIENGDTLDAALVKTGTIDISGKERSSFLYYTIGAGKRIYSSKRFSTALRVGGGLSLLLSDQHKISGPVYDALKNQPNTFFGNTQSNIPTNNQAHFDLFTGFDFNYRFLARWSLSIEPTFKYYLSPLYLGNKSRSFSTGLRTGILFKL